MNTSVPSHTLPSHTLPLSEGLHPVAHPQTPERKIGRPPPINILAGEPLLWRCQQGQVYKDLCNRLHKTAKASDSIVH